MNEKKKRCSIIWFQNIIPAMYTVIPIKEKSTSAIAKVYTRNGGLFFLVRLKEYLSNLSS